MARSGPKKMAESTSPTDTSLSSLGSTPRADSADYETPGTTPATSIRGAATNKRKRSQLNKSVLQIEDSDEAMEDADLAMARRLQVEEYAHEEPQEEIAANKRQKFSGGKVQDSEEELSELSELSESESVHLVESEGELSEPESELSVDSEPLIKRVKKSAGLQHELEMKHRGKPVHKPAPGPSKGKGKQEAAPVRAAHAIARKSIGQTLKTRVEDSESELDSEEEFQVTESEAVSTGVSDNELDDQDVPLAAPAAVRNRRRHGGRGRNGRRFGNYTEADALKVFQLEGLDWMTRQEKSHYKGGLLGDEMGMGKTIQAVSLIMSDFPQKIPTLVIVPPVALMQWSAEINQYTDGKLNVLVYHGQNSKVKGMSVKALKKFDVIMISYNSLESLHRKETKGWSRGENIIKEASPIHAIHFHRLILDEAHSIKSRTTGVAKACFALKGTYKWCLSGTPVQNRIGEFFSLLRFLEVRPFADYFCKRCPCSILHWKLDDDHMCESCKHSGMEHVSVFNQELLNPLTQSEEAADRTEAMDKLHMITARIMLRRMKRDYTSSMELPPKEVIVHNEFFGEIERDFSSSIMSNTARQFDTYVAKGVMLNNYANIFGLIMQMRQVANHPDLLLKRHAQQGQNVLVCNICDEVAEEAIRSQCKHDFCRSCVKSYLQSVEQTGGDADCPRCHIALAIDLDQPDIEQDEDVVKKSSIINRIKMENWTSSTKIEMLVYDLYKLRSKKQTLKSIVFSQFTSMLQLIEWRLRRAGFNTVMLDGSMTPIQRQRSIEYFMNNSDVEVFLVSLKAGGVALNLTEASRVFIVDPWWNPAAEWQSADRCHRIGQRRPCVITRLCIEDSVESRMVMLQEKKANMINGTINNDKTSMEKLTPEDMQFLFRGT
ncbi:hypothetical protein B0A54_09120 [Friedmanniomyces endolithicus]|uniref:DNA repair protein RAD16 n=1 Tax=Friedmanniomyces endolithicus TaxID=329885 RepID=A0A4U0UQN3_9PEZI|nr:hypothetical protein B0A54_09120 [Friedmanniomyces endolithicus]